MTQKTNKDRLGEVLSTLIDELELRKDLSEVPIKDLINSIVNTAKLIQTVEGSTENQDPIKKAIDALKR